MTSKVLIFRVLLFLRKILLLALEGILLWLPYCLQLHDKVEFWKERAVRK